MKWLGLSCKKAAFLIDKKSVVSLSRMENWRLSYHQSICEACKAYEKQSLVIDMAAQKMREGTVSMKLSEEAKHLIVNALNKR